MPLHLIKLSVGTDSIADLQGWIDDKIKAQKKRGVKKPERIHTTRMVPKRADELKDGGSIYWVIKGQIMCREVILDIRPFTDKDGIHRCKLVLDPKCIPVEPRPRAAFQASLVRRQGGAARSRQDRQGRAQHARGDAPRTDAVGVVVVEERASLAPVIPAKAGIQLFSGSMAQVWMPASAGMSGVSGYVASQ